MIATPDPSQNRIKLTGLHEWLVYAVVTLVFSSGAAWAWLHSMRAPGEVGESPAELWMQKIHGAAAMLALILLGSLLAAHIPRAWRAHRNRRSGATLLTLFALLSGTGYALYYSGNESLRLWMSSTHLWIGLAWPLFLALHVWRGKRLR